ncbi:MAG TPA: hypothetical protein VFN03_05210 [Trueperaceae bacterium]|nr:hypothetical protein [Trueperaceae bacterium]
MNLYDYQRLGNERTARLHREAAVGAIARASGAPALAKAAARLLRRLAEGIDHAQQSAGRGPTEVTQPTMVLALTEA